ncbi:MAG: GNAT family N-acetyltransferase [Methanolinea sp.]|nr:GNAT family N-acetyltransferase [Methanolinea sp.]
MIVKDWDANALVTLYRAGGWWREDWDPAEIPRLVRASFAFAIAIHRESGKTVGMGRAISDGVSDAYIQDLVVLPEFRGSGAGRMLLEKLVEECFSRGITWIALVAEPGTVNFYAGSGFVPMEGHVPMRFRGKGPGC